MIKTYTADEIDEIRKTLKYMTGTEHYYARGWFGMVYTDGVKAMVDMCCANWFVDIIVSYQCHKKIATEDFQVWTLVMNKKGNGAKVICTDGNDNVLASQRIGFTDFPLKEGITLWVENHVILLPSEH